LLFKQFHKVSLQPFAIRFFGTQSPPNTRLDHTATVKNMPFDVLEI